MTFKKATSKESIPEEYDQLYDRAVRLLARRGHGTWELRTKLLQRGVDATVVDEVLDRCKALNYLNDFEFALSRARYRIQHGGYGPGRVRAELRSLRIEDRDIQKALDDILSETSSYRLAEKALNKRFGNQKDGAAEEVTVLSQKELKKRYDYLARRGFDNEDIWQVLG